MKLVILLLVTAMLQVSASTYGQTVTIKQKNATLVSVFDQIRKQTGYDFIYSDKAFDNFRAININVKNEPIANVLELCLKDQPVSYTIENKIVTIKPKEKTIVDRVIDYFLNIDVKGRVIDENNQPLVGASVQIKGDNRLVTTNEKGEFSITGVDEKAVLVVSFIGYKFREIGVKKEIGDIQLVQAIAKLDEVSVVNTGYEKLPKERATGSFTLIDNKTYNQQVGTSVLERLRYITNGVAAVPDRVTNFGENAMLIRGMSTLTLSVQRPLVIVDNFEYQGDLNNINPNDIENVSFLKDAASGSIWGAKAANGVIVITTKKGKFGQAIKVNLSANLTTAAPPNLFYEQAISAKDLIEVEQMLFANKYRFTDTARTTRPPFSPAYELMFKHKNGQLTTAQLNEALAQLGNQDVRNDFDKYFYQNETAQQYAISLSGGSPSMAWSLGLGTDRNSSNLAARYNRNTIRWDNQLQLHKKLALSFDAAFTNSVNKSGRPSYGSIKPTNGILPVYSIFADQQGNALPLYTQHRQGFIDNIGGDKLFDWRYYPLEDYKAVNTTHTLNDINATMGLNYTVLSWLAVDLKYRIARQWSDLGTLNGEQSYFTRNLINNFTQVNTNGLVTYKVPKGSIYDTTNETMTAQNLRAQLNINKQWAKHQLNFLAGSEWSERKNIENTLRRYGYDSENLNFGQVDYTNMYPTYMSGGNSLISYIDNYGGKNNRFISFYANGAYTWSNRYTISASARRDASNLFGVATNDRWQPFWSLGSAWNMDREKWFKLGFVKQAKLRASYGLQGNIDPTKVAVTTLSVIGNNVYTQSPISRVNNYPNPDLKWEQVAMLNLGLEFGAFNNQLSASVEYYNKRMSDLYANVEVDRTTGISSGTVVRNIGQAIGHGWDIELRTQQQVAQTNIRADLIFNTYTDKVTKLNGNVFTGTQVMALGFAILEGYAPSSLFAYQWAGLDPQNGDPQGYLNGQLSKDYSAIVNQTKVADAVYIGSQLPKIFGSMGASLEWRGFALAMRMTYKVDYFFKRQSIEYNQLVTQLKGHADYAKRWQKPGDELITNVPAMVYPVINLRDEFYRNTSILYEKADHIRLQYINLSYELNKAQFKWLPVRSARLGIMANNLGIIWRANKNQLDPEAGTFPRSEKISLNMNINF